MSFPSYLEYKNVKVKWLGDIPSGWKVKRFKQVFVERDERSLDGSQTLLSVSAYTGVSPRSEIRDQDEHISRSESLEGYKVCYPNDLVINIMLAWNRGLGVSSHYGIVSPAYCVFKIIDDSEPDFLDYLVRTDEYTGYFKAFSSGVIDSRLRIYPDTFGSLYVALPNKAEQKNIADFLDHEITKIDILVAEQEKLIELLKEKRHAVISYTVTKGLNPNVKMKDSGVAWLGDIPEHWELKKIKWCAKLKNEKTSDRSNAIALENIESWTGRFIDTESEFEGDGVKFNDGDVLFGKLRPYLAKVFRATKLGEAIGDFFVLEPNQNLLSQFAERLFISSEFIDAINSSTYGTKMPRVNWEYFSSMSIPLPPKHEQIQISNYLVTAIEEMDELIATSINAVDLLEERRSALISAAVTGQIDVRNYQPKEVA